MSTLRIECSAEGFNDNWLELRTAWTRGDTKRLDNATSEDDILDIIAGRVVKCNVVTADGETLTTGEDITVDNVDRLDEVLAQWLVASIYQMIGHRRRLGNLSASVSSATKGATVPTPKTQATETPTA